MGRPFRYSYHTTIEIHASKDAVWKVLMDLKNYYKWNPFTPKIEMDWEIGHEVLLTVQMKKENKPIRQKEYLKRFNPPNELAWGMNWGIFLKAERVQLLSTPSKNKTRYFTEDIIKGILAPMVHWIYGASIQRGFEQAAKSLKTHIEQS